MSALLEACCTLSARFVDQLDEIIDAVGGKIDIICDGGIRRGSHILKALSKGANACSGGRLYLYALASGGEVGVTKAIENLKNEVERDMKLMGVTKINQLNRTNLRFKYNENNMFFNINFYISISFFKK